MNRVKNLFDPPFRAIKNGKKKKKGFIKLKYFCTSNNHKIRKTTLGMGGILANEATTSNWSQNLQTAHASQYQYTIYKYKYIIYYILYFVIIFALFLKFIFN